MPESGLPLRNFLEIPYDMLEEMSLEARAKRDSVDPNKQETEYRNYLENEKRIKAVTVCFTDIEGKMHMLDYDKKFFLESTENLTFDGSSIRGFTAQKESDLRLSIDWTSFHWLPSDVFGPGKVIVFGNVQDREKGQYESDFRGLLQQYTRDLKKREGIVAYAAPEIEGFLFAGVNAEQHFDEKEGFKLISEGGYFHSLPLDPLRQFIDATAETQRAMGFKNEKDHPEVAPSQFEINFSYDEILRTADRIQLYKLVCKQIANKMGMTASFLPKPVVGINGSGMHTNFSLAKNGKNLFYQKGGKDNLSSLAWDIIAKVLNHAEDICLVLNSSVNAYRRLDPHFEAPNQIKVSPNDRGSMIRIPTGNEKTARIEIRSVAPDANPYLVLYTIIKTAMEGTTMDLSKQKDRYLPGNVNDAISLFEKSTFAAKVMGEANKSKYLSFKKASAARCARELGTKVKTAEVVFHHEVTNQVLWNNF
ncbi:MAG: glutamine synthetase [Patescibacteria group bacterium]|nr:glutamine synthetase [Patescibacteria group bacterium]